jgi:class 3 adenylate cyclase
MTARLGDIAATELVRAHDALVRRALARHDGREVKHLGDGIMASFDSTAAAVECAKAIQKAFERFNRSSMEQIHIRIGVDCGEPVEDTRDLFGSIVQRAGCRTRFARNAVRTAVSPIAGADISTDSGIRFRFLTVTGAQIAQRRVRRLSMLGLLCQVVRSDRRSQ